MGFLGIFVFFVDGLKLFFKEDVVLVKVDFLLFILGFVIVVVFVFFFYLVVLFG